ncbi:MAG: hypothetical protein M1813_005456 [Trichoglossum hirsutum]|nr:MAG: hypothetical protein M1813_005456 [Trichoglossum hirsutum]
MTPDSSPVAVRLVERDTSEPEYLELEKVGRELPEKDVDIFYHNPDHLYDTNVSSDSPHQEDVDPESDEEMTDYFSWRERAKLRVLNLFCVLVSEGVIDPLGSPQPSNSRNRRKEVQDLMDILVCFNDVSSEKILEVGSIYEQDLEDPIEWLATAILTAPRISVQDILDIISRDGLLGELNDVMYGKYLRRRARTPRVASRFYTLKPNLRPSRLSSGVDIETD